MSIAQHSVAGEGVFCPLSAESIAASSDAEAQAQFTCDNTNLPWIIFRAAHRAAHLSGIPARSRALLSALARTVDASRPYAAIYARRELLTGRALQSMRTFYRSLDDLEAAGLIHRPPQKRHGAVGLFGRAYLHLTPRAATLLGLVETPTEAQPAAERAPEPQEVNVASCSPLDPPSASMADGAIYKDLYPASQKRQPGPLPADLQRLRSLGFHEFLIFKLMREARQHGKLLSDVVAVVWEHLQVAYRPIAYLRKLLTTPADFRHQRVAHEAAVEAARQAQHETEQLSEIIARCSGQTFLDPAGERRVVIGVEASTMQSVDEPQPRTMAGAWQAGFVAALRRGQLVPATPELEEQFAAGRRERLQVASARAVPASQPRAITPSIREHLAQALRSARQAGGAGLAVAA